MGKLQWWSVALSFIASVTAIAWGVGPEKRPAHSRASDLLRAQAARRLDFPTDELAIDAEANLEHFLAQALGPEAPVALISLWRDNKGNQFAVTLLDGASGAGAIWKISPDGRVRDIHDFRKINARSAEDETQLTPNAQFAAILDGLMTPAPDGTRDDGHRLAATPPQ